MNSKKNSYSTVTTTYCHCHIHSIFNHSDTNRLPDSCKQTPKDKFRDCGTKNTILRKLLPIHRERELPILPRICSKASKSSR